LSPTLDELLAHYCLTSRFDPDDYRGRRLIKLAEAQNWKCCYCGVRMFAGHPLEDVFLYSQSMGLSVFLNGDPDRFTLLQLSKLRASLEHLHGTRAVRPGAVRECVAACRYCNSNRGGFASKLGGGGIQHTPESWHRITQRLVESGRHPHSQYL
jgi:hypothetical protein